MTSRRNDRRTTLAELLSAIAWVPTPQALTFDQPAFVAPRTWVQADYPTAAPKDGLNFAVSAALDHLGVRGAARAGAMSDAAEAGLGSNRQSLYRGRIMLRLVNRYEEIAHGEIKVAADR